MSTIRLTNRATGKHFRVLRVGKQNPLVSVVKALAGVFPDTTAAFDVAPLGVRLFATASLRPGEPLQAPTQTHAFDIHPVEPDA